MNEEVLYSECCGVFFKNPVLLASGTFGLGDLFPDVISSAGGFITKALSLNPIEGNPPPRLYDDRCYLINSVGLENPGVDYFIDNILDKIPEDSNLIVNIVGKTVNEYELVAKKLDGIERISAVEINLSCPNTRREIPARSAQLTEKILSSVRNSINKPIWAKLSPNYVDVFKITQASVKAGADAVVIFNTFYGMAIDVYSKRRILGAGSGGVSSPGFKPFNMYTIYEIKRRFDISVIASGGVRNGRDVLEYIMSGASLVEIGSINLVEPKAVFRILNEILELIKKLNIKNFDEINLED